MSLETDLLASVVIVVCQSLVYGIFFVLIPISTASLIKRGIGSRANGIMLVIIWTMFALSTAHWAISLAFLVTKVNTQAIVEGPPRVRSDDMNAVVTINFGVADGVVVWRVWVLCKNEYKKALIGSLVLLGFTIAFIIATIALRGVISTTTPIGGHARPAIHNALGVIEIVPIVLSLITNVLSTVIVGLYVWKYRRFLRENLSRNKTTRVERILVLLFESGLLYALYLVFSIIGSNLRVSIGTIGDVTNSVLALISGLYPTIIITLISIQGTVHTSTFSVSSTRTQNVGPVNVSVHDGQLASVRFGQNPALFTHNIIEDDQDRWMARRRTNSPSSMVFSDFQVKTVELASRGWEGPWFDKSEYRS